MRYRGTGVPMSRAVAPPHGRSRPRPRSALALLAALITVWLGSVAQFGGGRGGAGAGCRTSSPWSRSRPGRRCSRSPRRVAPDAPVGQVVERIRELNELDSAALDAGQTLIAPIG